MDDPRLRCPQLRAQLLSRGQVGADDDDPLFTTIQGTDEEAGERQVKLNIKKAGDEMGIRLGARWAPPAREDDRRWNRRNCIRCSSIKPTRWS